MENKLVVIKVGKDIESFKWRSRGGKFHSVKDMETRHLFLLCV